MSEARCRPVYFRWSVLRKEFTRTHWKYVLHLSWPISSSYFQSTKDSLVEEQRIHGNLTGVISSLHQISRKANLLLWMALNTVVPTEFVILVKPAATSNQHELGLTRTHPYVNIITPPPLNWCTDHPPSPSCTYKTPTVTLMYHPPLHSCNAQTPTHPYLGVLTNLLPLPGCITHPPPSLWCTTLVYNLPTSVTLTNHPSTHHRRRHVPANQLRVPPILTKPTTPQLSHRRLKSAISWPYKKTMLFCDHHDNSYVI